MSEPDRQSSPRTNTALAILVVGLSLNTIGVVLVALRGIAWGGLLLMVLGIGLLLYAVLLLVSEAKRKSTPGEGR